MTDQTGAPLPGASVQVAGDSAIAVQSTLTDTRGQFAVPALPQGEYKIQASRPGFMPGQVPVRAEEGKTQQVQLALQASNLNEAIAVDGLNSLPAAPPPAQAPAKDNSVVGGVAGGVVGGVSQWEECGIGRSPSSGRFTVAPANGRGAVQHRILRLPGGQRDDGGCERSAVDVLDRRRYGLVFERPAVPARRASCRRPMRCGSRR